MVSFVINSILMAGRFFLIVVSMFLVGTSVFGQNHFIYIQSENKEPFYVKWQDRTVASSASGYVVIPKVQDGDHTVQIGFSSDSWLLKKFSFRIAGRDAGFMLKKTGEDSWVLYNLQTTRTILAEAGPVASTVYPRSDDAFVNILADVVEMPSLNKPEEKPKAKDTSVVIAKEASESKVVSTEGIGKSGARDTVTRLSPMVQEKAVVENIKTDLQPSVVNNKKEEVPPRKEKSVARPADSVRMNQKPVVVRQDAVAAVNDRMKSASPADSAPKAGGEILAVNNYLHRNERLMLFIVSEGLQKDTVDILMEYPGKRNREKKKSEKKSIEKEEPVKPVEKPAVQEGLKAEVKAEVQKPAGVPVAAAVPEKVSFIYCKDSASADDFLKLRKRMAAENSEDAMLERAGKVFRSKCFTVNQVRNLSYLFMDEEKKLLFLESSYPCVPDKSNFGTLENLLTDPARIGRLRNLYRPKK